MIRKSIGKLFHVVWLDDPALDHDHPDFPAKWQEHEDSGEVAPLADVTAAGSTLTIFDCLPLTPQGFMTVMTTGDGISMLVEAVRYGVKQVHNLEVDGLSYMIDAAQDFERDGKEKRLRQDVIDKLWEPEVFSYVGNRIIARSKLPPRSGQR